MLDVVDPRLLVTLNGVKDWFDPGTEQCCCNVSESVTLHLGG